MGQQQTAGSMTSLASRAYRALAGTSVGSSLENTGVRCGAVAGSSHWAQSQSQSAGRVSSWASYSTGTGNNLKTGDELLESMEHATGLELAEREGKARGVDIFTEGEAWL